MDPTCGADPAELMRHPIVLVEHDHARAEHLVALFSQWRMPREVRWLRTVDGARRALTTCNASGWVVAAEAVGRSTRPLLARVRAAHPKMPLFVTPPTTDDAVCAWCHSLEAAYLPGTLSQRDALSILDDVEGFEVALVSNLAFVVRRAQPARLQPHEAEDVVDYLEGTARRPWTKAESHSSARSRARKKLGVDRLHDLIRERRNLRARYDLKPAKVA